MVRVIVGVIGIVSVVVSVAAVDSFADNAARERVEQLVRDGRIDAARAVLVDVVEADDVEVASLEHAAMWALRLEDADLLGRVRAAAERVEVERGVKHARLDLALGTAYLGLAEQHLKARTGGSSVALLFADAESRAKPHLETHDSDRTAAAGAAWLLARARYAQGDVPGAITAIEAAPSLEHVFRDRLEARLRYERAAAAPVGSDGRPTEATRKDLQRTRERLAGVQRAADVLLDTERREDAMLAAWAAHRMGDVDGAREQYFEAHDLGPETARLARRGLASLFANDKSAHLAALLVLVDRVKGDATVHDAIVQLHRAEGRTADAIVAVQRRILMSPRDPVGWTTAGAIFHGIQQWGEAITHYRRALEIDPAFRPAASGLEQVALSLVASDFERALDTYDKLLALRPGDPYAHNNLGFILREKVSPWTEFRPGGIQKLKADTPVRIRELLVRCRDVYAVAVALIPEEDDESRELLESWNLAGIVNDYGLMLHYFADIQNGPLAEQMYLRTLRMTDDGFKDTYSPNLQRLYAIVLKGRELSWVRLARRCKEAVLMERQVDGALELVPDPAKRLAAEQDEQRLRARIVQELRSDAEEDGAPWPPKAGEGNGR